MPHPDLPLRSLPSRLPHRCLLPSRTAPRRLNIARTVLTDISTVLPEPTPRPLPVVSGPNASPANEPGPATAPSGGLDLGSLPPDGVRDPALPPLATSAVSEATEDPVPVESPSALDDTAPAARYAAPHHHPLPLQRAQQTESAPSITGTGTRTAAITGTATGTGTGTGSAPSVQRSPAAQGLNVANSTVDPITAISPPPDATAFQPARPETATTVSGLSLQTSKPADDYSREIGIDGNPGQEPSSQGTSTNVVPVVTPVRPRQLLPLQRIDRHPTRHGPTSTQGAIPAPRSVESPATVSRALPLPPNTQHNPSDLGGHDIADGAVSGAGVTPSKMGPALRPVARQARLQRAVLDSPTSAAGNPGPMRSPDAPLPATLPLAQMFSSSVATPQGGNELPATTRDITTTAAAVQREGTGDGDDRSAAPPHAAPSEPSSGAMTVPAVTPGSAPTSGASGAATPGASGADIDELARRLFDPLSARLRSELWLDRERAGLSIELRR